MTASAHHPVEHCRPPGQCDRRDCQRGAQVFERELLQADFKPIKGSKIGESAAHFEIVLGRTPDDRSSRR